MKDLSFLSMFRTRPGGKSDAVPQPYNNVERLLKFKLAMLARKIEEVRREVTQVCPNHHQWPFNKTAALNPRREAQ